MSFALTSDAINCIFGNVPIPSPPTLQILKYKPAQSGNVIKCYVSDSSQYTVGAIHGNAFTTATGPSSGFADFCIIRALKYESHENKCVVISELEVLGQGESIIGSPAKFPSAELPRPPPVPMDTSTDNQHQQQQQENQQKQRQYTEYQQQQQEAPVRQQPALQQMDLGALPTDPITPIEHISQYSSKIAVKGRVTGKTPLRTWKKNDSEGKLFSFDFLDQSGEIRVTAFSEVAEQLFPVVEIDSVYIISRFRIARSKPQFSSNNHDCELHLSRDSVLTKVPSDDPSIPKMMYSFVSFDKISALPKDKVIDVIGVIKAVDAISTIVAKTTQKELTKRNVELICPELLAVTLTLWGAEALGFDADKTGSVLAVKGARINDFNGRSLSTTFSSKLTTNPDIPEARQLFEWYSKDGSTASFTSISTGYSMSSQRGSDEIKFISAIKDEGMGLKDSPDYLSVVATVNFVKTDGTIAYMACPGSSCRSKAVEEGPGQYHCNSCDKVYPNCLYKYVLSFEIIDITGSTWVSCFNEVAEQLVGQPADEIMELRMSGSTSYERLLTSFLRKTYTFRLRAQSNEYQGERRVRVQVLSASPVDLVADSKSLIETIRKYGA